MHTFRGQNHALVRKKSSFRQAYSETDRIFIEDSEHAIVNNAV